MREKTLKLVDSVGKDISVSTVHPPTQRWKTCNKDESSQNEPCRKDKLHERKVGERLSENHLFNGSSWGTIRKVLGQHDVHDGIEYRLRREVAQEQ